MYFIKNMFYDNIRILDRQSSVKQQQQQQKSEIGPPQNGIPNDK